jgi:glutathione S-transferase
MILYNGPTSPFGRMARAAALELGLSVEERSIDVYTAKFLDAINPLRQIPTLVLDDAAPVYDSRVICRHFDALAGRRLLPESAGVDVERRWALAIGTMEAGLLRRMELVRPPGEKSQAVIDKLAARILRALAALEQEAEVIEAAGMRMDTLAIAVALEYTDFRFTRDWRDACPRLARWLEAFGQRPCLLATRPRETQPA